MKRKKMPKIETIIKKHDERITALEAKSQTIDYLEKNFEEMKSSLSEVNDDIKNISNKQTDITISQISLKTDITTSQEKLKTEITTLVYEKIKSLRMWFIATIISILLSLIVGSAAMFWNLNSNFNRINDKIIELYSNKKEVPKAK